MKLLGITEQIVRFLLLKIREGDLKSGERLMSEKEMCEFFGVSRKPVRAAFEYLCQNHVVVSKKGSGYYVCDAADCGEHLLKQCEKSYRFGVVLFDNNYFRDIIEGMNRAARDFGCELIYLPNHTIEEEYASIRTLVESRVDGIIISPLRSGEIYSRENYSFIEQERIPMVMIGKRPSNVVCDSIYCDDVHIAETAVQELFRAGCDRVIHITDYNSDEVAINERSEGYELGVEHYYPDLKAIVLNVRDARYREKLTLYLKGEGKLGFYLIGTPLVQSFLQEVGEISAKTGKSRRLNKNYFIVSHGQDDLESVPEGVKVVIIPKFKIGYITVRRMLERVGGRLGENRFYSTILTQKILEKT